MAGTNTADTPHKEASKKRVKIDAESVQKIMIYLKDQRDLFQHNTELVSLTSGVLASDDVSYDLFHAETKGEQALADFVESRLRTGTTDSITHSRSSISRHLVIQRRQKQSSFRDNTKSALAIDFFARSLVIATEEPQKDAC